MDKKEKFKQIREKYDVEFYLEVVPTLCVEESTPALAPSMAVIDFCYEQAHTILKLLGKKFVDTYS